MAAMSVQQRKMSVCGPVHRTQDFTISWPEAARSVNKLTLDSGLDIYAHGREAIEPSRAVVANVSVCDPKLLLLLRICEPLVDVFCPPRTLSPAFQRMNF